MTNLRAAWKFASAVLGKPNRCIARNQRSLCAPLG